MQPRVYLSFVCASVLCVLSTGQDTLKYNIDEESSIDTLIGNVGTDSNLRATASGDDFSQIRYSLLSQAGSAEQYFRIDSHDGSLYTAAVIDREAIPACAYQTSCVLTLSVVAKSEISAYFKRLTVDVTILDINDNSPVFDRNSTSLDINEVATVGSSVSLPGAVDHDSGNFSLHRYYIRSADVVSVDGDVATDLPFDTQYERYVDGSSVVKLTITGKLDRETRDSYDFVIVAEDGGEPARTGTLDVSVNIGDTNDNSPIFSQPLYNVTVNETMAVGATILTVAATDADKGDNQAVEYRLSRNQLGLVHERFFIDQTSGVLTLKKKFESGGEYRVIVEASDRGQQPLMSQTVVIVTVLDSDNNRPEINVNLFSDSGIATISEYAEVGTVVAHVGLIDRDTGNNGVITCNMVSDEGVFQLQDYSENEYKVVVGTSLDRETLDYIYVVINCYDKGVPPLEAFVEFTVQVLDENDHAPEFLQQIYFVDIAENNVENVDMVQVSARDRDLGQNSELMYSMWAPGDYRFHMDPLSGFITAVSSFDYEADSKVTVYAYARDRGQPPRTSTATVVITVTDVNDNDPSFSAALYEFSVHENRAPGTDVNATTVTDRDSGNNGKIGFRINDTLPFVIDDNGHITTKQVLDREVASTYFFMVTAFDHGVPVRNATANVVIYVSDDNDNTPQFIFPDAANYTVVVDADSHVNTVLTTIRAFDLDSGLNGLLHYSLTNTNATDLFYMDGASGEISLARPFQPSDRDIYYLTVRVTDHGKPSKFSTTSIGLFVSRKVPPTTTDEKGENLLIAITLGVVTFVLVFTIVLVIFILRRKWVSGKDESDSEDRFCDRDDRDGKDRRVKFADLTLVDRESPRRTGGDPKTSGVTMETMSTFSNDGNESRDSEMTTSTVDMETPILEKHKSREHQISPVTVSRSADMATPPHVTQHTDSQHSTPRHDNQISALKTHSALLQSAVKPSAQFGAYGGHGHGHEDNHSQTSGETITSDSGRGGSESDIHSASLSQSHDSDMKPSELRLFRNPAHSTMIEARRPYMNLADLRHHRCPMPPVAKQLQMDQRHRLQIKNFKNINNAKDNNRNNNFRHSVPEFDRAKFVTFQDPPAVAPPASDIDRTFMTYDEEDDDMSTTTSGSYTIEHDDVSLDITHGVHKPPGLRSCLV